MFKRRGYVDVEATVLGVGCACILLLILIFSHFSSKRYKEEEKQWKKVCLEFLGEEKCAEAEFRRKYKEFYLK